MYNKQECLSAIKAHMQTWLASDEVDSNHSILIHRAQTLKDGETSKPYIGYTIHRYNANEYKYTYTNTDINTNTNTSSVHKVEDKPLPVTSPYYETEVKDYKLEIYGTQLPHTISTNEIKLISYAQAVAYIAGMLYSQLPSHMDKDAKRAAADSIVMDILDDHTKVFQSQNKILFCVEDNLYMAKSLSCFKLLDPYNLVLNHPHVLPILCNDLQYCRVLTYKDCL